MNVNTSLERGQVGEYFQHVSELDPRRAVAVGRQRPKVAALRLTLASVRRALSRQGYGTTVRKTLRTHNKPAAFLCGSLPVSAEPCSVPGTQS